jgi:hypothetical protein
MTEARQRDRRWGLTAAKELATVIAGRADSRRSLEEQLGVSKASVCRVVDPLPERGLLMEGRRCAIAADWSIQRILRSWRSLIAEALESAQIDRNHVIAIGVALLSVLVRYGIGMNVSSRGRFIVGEELACGEPEHMRVRLDGPLCICGLRGCLDAFCWERTWPDVNERLGEAWQISIAERAQILEIGIGNLLKLIHSPLVILNGVYNDYQEIVREPLCAAVGTELSPLGLSTPRLAFGARLEEKACIGAALRAIDQQMADYLERFATCANEVLHTGMGES